MSVVVDVSQLAAEVARFDFAYLLTIGDDGRPHALALRPQVIVDEGNGLRLRFASGGGRAYRNARDRPVVSVVFPPVAGAAGFSLVVDGTATASGDMGGDMDGAFVDVHPTSAVRHRPAP